MRKLNTIYIHCTATRKEWWADRRPTEKVDEVRRWHTQGRGWSDVGYHYLIDLDGTVVEGRPIEKAGAHVKGHNANSVGISLFGGHGSDQYDKFRGQLHTRAGSCVAQAHRAAPHGVSVDHKSPRAQ